MIDGQERLLALGFGVIALAAGGCSWPLRRGQLGDANYVATGADVRLVTSVPDPGVTGHRQVTCAEPSPDIAKAVAEALSLAAKLHTQGEASGELNASRAYAEGVIRLTERMATIQLMRDSLYRACEAYANGVLSETSYAMLLNRYDDSMITMLTAELAARSFPSVGEGSPTISAKAGDLSADSQGAKTATDLVVAQGSTVTGGNKSSRTEAEGANDSVEVARTIADMQRKFIENVNFNPILMACMNVMDRRDAQSTELVSFCREQLESIVQFMQEEVRLRIRRSTPD
jgi:hypothetical protein